MQGLNNIYTHILYYIHILQYKYIYNTYNIYIYIYTIYIYICTTSPKKTQAIPADDVASTHRCEPHNKKRARAPRCSSPVASCVIRALPKPSCATATGLLWWRVCGLWLHTAPHEINDLIFLKLVIQKTLLKEVKGPGSTAGSLDL